VRWLVDECVDAGLVSHLRAAGHDAVYMAEVAPRDSDAEVTARAQAEQRLLLTEDKDFGDLVFRRGQSVPGVVLLRLDPAMHALKRAPARRGDRSIRRKSARPLYDCRASKVSLAAIAEMMDSPRRGPQRFSAAYRKAGGDIALEYIDADRHAGRSPDLSQTGDMFARMVEFIGRHVR
jgi:predicted nuclease of predicted toxin-antitoxin system